MYRSCCKSPAACLPPQPPQRAFQPALFVQGHDDTLQAAVYAMLHTHWVHVALFNQHDGGHSQPCSRSRLHHTLCLYSAMAILFCLSVLPSSLSASMQSSRRRIGLQFSVWFEQVLPSGFSTISSHEREVRKGRYASSFERLHIAMSIKVQVEVWARADGWHGHWMCLKVKKSGGMEKNTLSRMQSHGVDKAGRIQQD